MSKARRGWQHHTPLRPSGPPAPQTCHVFGWAAPELGSHLLWSDSARYSDTLGTPLTPNTAPLPGRVLFNRQRHRAPENCWFLPPGRHKCHRTLPAAPRHLQMPWCGHGWVRAFYKRFHIRDLPGPSPSPVVNKQSQAGAEQPQLLLPCALCHGDTNSTKSMTNCCQKRQDKSPQPAHPPPETSHGSPQKGANSPHQLPRNPQPHH